MSFSFWASILHSVCFVPTYCFFSPCNFFICFFFYSRISNFESLRFLFLLPVVKSSQMSLAFLSSISYFSFVFSFVLGNINSYPLFPFYNNLASFLYFSVNSCSFSFFLNSGSIFSYLPVRILRATCYCLCSMIACLFWVSTCKRVKQSLSTFFFTS